LARPDTYGRVRRVCPGDGQDHVTVAEVMLRLAVALLLIPGGGLALDSDGEMRAFARNYLARLC